MRLFCIYILLLFFLSCNGSCLHQSAAGCSITANSIDIAGEELGSLLSSLRNRLDALEVDSHLYPQNCTAACLRVPSGTRLIYPFGAKGEPITVYCECDTLTGGWMLVASNSKTDPLFPPGEAQFINSHNEAFHANPSPQNDYVIGPLIESWNFTQVLISGMYKENQYVQFVADLDTYPSVTSPENNYTHLRNDPTINFRHSLARYFVFGCRELDAGYDSNAYQRTTGGCIVQDASGDSSLGCYVGHGDLRSPEESAQGMYDATGQPYYFQNYATYVR
eukprot:GCRY01001827.1.p1 GENE.GCRY01001827.1~~GCRY01001827.1.p1  ORF type:complete len:278 (+),score=29.21 GCRY01001827.1:114-947(+)